MPKAAAGRGRYDARSFGLAVDLPAAAQTWPMPSEMGWTEFTDACIVLGGLDTTARRHLIRESLLAADRHLAKRQDLLDLVETWWGTWVATEVLHQLTRGGKKTWGRQGQKPGLLSLVDTLERPPIVSRRALPDYIWKARRNAIDSLYAFTVTVPLADIKSIQAQALNPGSSTSIRKGHGVSHTELHRRVAKVLRFYGVGSPVKNHGIRQWRLYPWRLWRVDHQLETYKDVRLASLDWLPPHHFRAALAKGRTSARPPPLFP